MLILVLSASTNERSNSDLLADAFVRGAQTLAGVTVEKIRLKDLSIEHFELKFYDPATPQGEDFLNVQKKIQEAAGVAIATPIWNFSVPAHLKNLLDRMGSFALDPETRSLGMLKGKPFFLIYTGGAGTAAWTGLMRLTMRHIHIALKYFGATTVDIHFEPRCVSGKGKFGLVVDKRPASLKRLERRGTWFANVAVNHAKTGALPLRGRIIHGIFDLGQKLLKKLNITP